MTPVMSHIQMAWPFQPNFWIYIYELMILETKQKTEFEK